jgi:hypothetical protein
MLFGDKSKFAIEVEFLEDPNGEKWTCWDEVGTYGHFDIFINGVSIFKNKQYDMVDAPDTFSGYKILETFTEYDDGRADHLAPIYEWLRYVHDTITAESKTRFKRSEINQSPYGTSGNIYPNFFIKRSGQSAVVGAESDRSDFFFNRHIEYTVSEKITLPWEEVSTILGDVLKSYYDNPSIKALEWYKQKYG